MLTGRFFTKRKVFPARRNDDPVPSGTGRVSARGLYRYIWRTSRAGQIAICAMTAVIAPMSMVILEIQRRLINDAVGARRIRMLAVLGAVYVAVICIRVGLKYLLDMTKGRTVETVARDLRLKIMKVTLARRRKGFEE